MFSAPFAFAFVAVFFTALWAPVACNHCSFSRALGCNGHLFTDDKHEIVNPQLKPVTSDFALQRPVKITHLPTPAMVCFGTVMESR